MYSYHGCGAEEAREPRAELADCIQFLCRRKIMFGSLTLIKRNGSEGSTMTMDSRETTIGRYVARALACRAPRAAHRAAARSNT